MWLELLKYTGIIVLIIGYNLAKMCLKEEIKRYGRVRGWLHLLLVVPGWPIGVLYYAVRAYFTRRQYALHRSPC